MLGKEVVLIRGRGWAKNCTRIVSPGEKLRGAMFEILSLMTILNKYILGMINLRNKLEEEELYRIAVLWDLNKQKQDTEPPES